MKQNSIRTIALIGMMSAMIFVATRYISIQIPSPTGPTMLKTGNILCILAGLLLGKTNGGLAAGIGSALFDLTNPLYVTSAPFTFTFFFLMAFIAGYIHEKFPSDKIIPVACASGAFSYVILYFSKSVISTILEGSAVYPAFIANLTKLGTSSFNAVVACVFASILFPVFVKSLKMSGIDIEKLAKN